MIFVWVYLYVCLLCENLLYKFGTDFCLSRIKSSQNSDEAFPLEGIERNRFPYQNARRM